MFLESADKKAERESKNISDGKEWEKLPICGQRYKHLMGVRANCPKCGGRNWFVLGDSNKEDIKGIPC